MASSIDYSQLPLYVEQSAAPFLREAVLEGKTIKRVSVITGNKGTIALPQMTSNLVEQAGGCGPYSATGSVSVFNRTITVVPRKVEETICIEDQEPLFLQLTMKAGSNSEDPSTVFKEAYTADKIAKIQRLISDNGWKGSNTGAFSANYTAVNGWLHDALYTSATASIFYSGMTATGPLTSTNAIPVVDALIDSMNTNAPDISERDDLEVYMSIPNFMTYTRAWRDRGNGTGNYWVDPNATASHEFVIPGTTIKIVGDVSLNGVNKIALTYPSNLWFSTDLESDAKNFSIEYIYRDNILLFRAKYKIGFRIAQPRYFGVHNG